MPIYEYRCFRCGTQRETIRRIVDRDEPVWCGKGHAMERIVSVPVMQAWNPDRPFPNAVHFGDGKFPTKAAYEANLKEHGMAESAIDGRNKSKVPRSMRVKHG